MKIIINMYSNCGVTWQDHYPYQSKQLFSLNNTAFECTEEMMRVQTVIAKIRDRTFFNLAITRTTTFLFQAFAVPIFYEHSHRPFSSRSVTVLRGINKRKSRGGCHSNYFAQETRTAHVCHRHDGKHGAVLLRAWNALVKVTAPTHSLALPFCACAHRLLLYSHNFTSKTYAHTTNKYQALKCQRGAVAKCSHNR